MFLEDIRAGAFVLPVSVIFNTIPATGISW